MHTYLRFGRWVTFAASCVIAVGSSALFHQPSAPPLTLPYPPQPPLQPPHSLFPPHRPVLD